MESSLEDQCHLSMFAGLHDFDICIFSEQKLSKEHQKLMGLPESGGEYDACIHSKIVTQVALERTTWYEKLSELHA